MLRRPRVGQPDVGVERDPLAVRVIAVGRVVHLAALAQWRAGPLRATDDRLLLAERRPVPSLDEHADGPRDEVGAADRPIRLALALADPDQLVHERGVGGGRVRGPVLEAEQVASGGRGAAVLDGPARPLLEAMDQPAHDERSARAEHQVAQRVEAARLVGRADLEEQVAVGEVGLDPVVAEVGHPHELARACGRPGRSGRRTATPRTRP